MGAAVALAGAGITMLFVSVSSDGNGDGTIPAQPAETATMTPWPTSTPDPDDIGWEAAAAGLQFEFVELYADSLTTEVRFNVEGRMQETGGPVIFITDTTGARYYFPNGSNDEVPGGVFEVMREAHPISGQPGTVKVEIYPVRPYVIPPLADDEPTPLWASFDVPFSGYASATVDHPLPEPNKLAWAGGDVSLDRLATTDREFQYEWSVGIDPSVNWYWFGEPGDTCTGRWNPTLYDANGNTEFGWGGGGGGGGGGDDPERRGYMKMARISGEFTLAFATTECLPMPVPTPVGTPFPGGGQAYTHDEPTPIPKPAGKSDLQHLRDTSLEVAEFKFTIP